MEAQVTFDPRLCDKNPYCPAVRSCPTGAMYMDRRRFTPMFDASKCTGCGTCLSTCPTGALSSR